MWRFFNRRAERLPAPKTACFSGPRAVADLNANAAADLTPLVLQSGGVPSTPGSPPAKTAAYAKNTTILEQVHDGGRAQGGSAREGGWKHSFHSVFLINFGFSVPLSNGTPPAVEHGGLSRAVQPT